jgi:hypothetical protein
VENVVLRLAARLEFNVDSARKLLLRYPRPTLRYYDFGPPSPPDEITPTDLGRLLVIEALYQRVAVPLLEAGQTASWHAVDPDARLVDADPEGSLYEAATGLFEHFLAIDGIGNAIASKLLHLKRPAFFPLLDSEITKLYRSAAEAAYRRSGVWKARHPEWRHLYWAAIREDLLLEENRDALVNLRDALSQSDAEESRLLMGASDVRLIDMLAWAASTEHAARRSGGGAVEGP